MVGYEILDVRIFDVLNVEFSPSFNGPPHSCSNGTPKGRIIGFAVIQRLEANIYFFPADTAIKAITAPQMLEIIHRVENVEL